jgi:hypothetical protein
VRRELVLVATGERRHLGRFRIDLVVEKHVEVLIFDRPEVYIGCRVDFVISSHHAILAPITDRTSTLGRLQDRFRSASAALQRGLRRPCHIMKWRFIHSGVDGTALAVARQIAHVEENAVQRMFRRAAHAVALSSLAAGLAIGLAPGSAQALSPSSAIGHSGSGDFQCWWIDTVLIHYHWCEMVIG